MKKKPTKKPQGDQKASRCFVLMPFSQPFDRYYQNIFVPAISAAGLEPIRADSLFRSSQIIGDIWRFVRESKLLLAELSGKNPNVFYELGLAHAIGKPVILVSNSIEDVPFDLRGLRVLVYDKDNESWGEDLRAAIRQAVKETLEDVEGAVPPTFLEPSHVSRPVAAAEGKELREILAEIRALRSEQNQTAVPLLGNYTGPVAGNFVLPALGNYNAGLIGTRINLEPSALGKANFITAQGWEPIEIRGRDGGSEPVGIELPTKLEPPVKTEDPNTKK